MGQRSVNTTKSGRYINPTDKARKEARRRELKKNRRLRQLSRVTALRNTDLDQLLEEMEKIDDMEYNVISPSPLNHSVLRDKRKKLKETFDRVMQMYYKDDPEQWAKMKRKEIDYERNRLKKQNYYESVKHTKRVQIDKIPLPRAVPPSSTMVRLPTFFPDGPLNSLKLNLAKSELLKKKKNLLDALPKSSSNMDELSDVDVDDENNEVFLQDYEPKSIKDKQMKSNSKGSEKKGESNCSDYYYLDDGTYEQKILEKSAKTNMPSTSTATETMSKSSIQTMKPSFYVSGFLLPPIPGCMPSMSSYYPQHHHLLPRIPGLPTAPVPRSLVGALPSQLCMRMPLALPNELPPTILEPQNQPNTDTDKEVKTITAKPKMKDLSADVIRFIPSPLLVKRHENKNSNKIKSFGYQMKNQPAKPSTNNTDDVYLQFMKEIKDLL